MILSRYKEATVLTVDYRFTKEFPRVNRILNDKGIFKVNPFVDGRGSQLPRSFYDHISTPVPPNWPESFGAYSQLGAIRLIMLEYENRKSEVDSFLFCEDDLIFSEDFDEVVNRAHEEIPDDWDMIYYGANHTGYPTNNVGPHSIRLNGSKCTHCVAIRNTLFGLIASLPDDIGFDTNVATRIHPNYKCYAVWPSVALQKPTYSVIWQQNVDYTELFKSKGINSD